VPFPKTVVEVAHEVDAREHEVPTSRLEVGAPQPVLADRYRLGEVLGVGGMGEVWGAVDLWLDRPVAVKVLRRNPPDGSEPTARFLHEARAMARLNHPHVVTVHDAGEHEGQQFLVMERLPGNSFANELEHAPIPPARVLQIVHGTLAGLGAAHAAGLIHRDVKPSNILFSSSGAVKLGDFGIAKGAGVDLTRAGDVLGTWPYLSPERLDGEAATRASDLYAVGIIMYEALAGERPYQGDTLRLIQEIYRAKPKSLRRLRPNPDPRLVDVVERAMHRDAGRRFASAEEMAEALPPVCEAAVEGDADPTVDARTGDDATREIGSATTTTAPTSSRWHRRAALAIGVVGGAVLAVAALVAGGDENPRGIGVVAADATTATTAPAAPAAPVETAATAATPPPTTSAPTVDAPATPDILLSAPPPAPTTTAVPATLDALIAALAADPASAGPRGPELLGRLQDVAGRTGKKQRDLARDVLHDVERWSGDDGLAPSTAAVASGLLRPLAGPEAGPGADED
jgi:hypothetical protein